MRPSIERVARRADEPPFAELWRVVAGAVVALAWVAVAADTTPAWLLLTGFCIVLLSCRTAPLVLRRLLPFEGSTQAVWFERRRLAKRYDSYQWRKLLWFGLGMTAVQAVVGWSSPPLVVLTVLCLLSGSAGVLVWRRRSWTADALAWGDS